MLSQRMMWIAWPAFLVACVLEALVFVLVDPQDLHWFGEPVMLSKEGIYTLAFFAFWAIAMVGGALTTMLSMSPFEVNRCPMAVDERPETCTKQDSCPP